MKIKPTYQELENENEILRQNLKIKERDVNFSAFFQYNKFIMLQINPKTKQIVEANEEAVKFYGYKKEELLKKTINDLNTISSDEISKLITATIKNKSNFIQLKHKLANEEIKDVEIYSSTVKVDNEIQIISCVHDITDRIKTDQALLESEEYFKAITENISEVISVIDKNGKSIYRSASYEKAMGFTNEEMLGQNVFQFIHSDDRNGLMLKLAESYKNPKKIVPIYFRAYHKDGSMRYLKGTGKNMLNSVVKGIVINYHDITDTKKAEAKIIKAKENAEKNEFVIKNQNEELQVINEELKCSNDELNITKIKIEENEAKLIEANKTKDKFLSIIAHDLKSPFNSMLGFSSLLNDNFNEYSTEEIKKFFAAIHFGIKNTYKLLENLLLWSRTQIGGIDFNPEKINLYLTSVDSIKLLNQLSEDKTIIIKNQISENLYINADKYMISTIIRNLISNAIKFTPKGGEITINTNKIRDKNNRKFTEILIADNGVGISKEMQLRLFDISKNTSTAGTENEKGTGLGLILCKEFTEKHNGKIKVESKEGSGSVFSFTIPKIDNEN